MLLAQPLVRVLAEQLVELRDRRGGRYCASALRRAVIAAALEEVDALARARS